ncbi:molybdopterin-dependent oxidoreductase [Mameliella alba]|nr:molybdopterin-dependent oxidoreductase [Mameliella alba]MBY6172617.1 molybdopterin-dependent oxidoreductase [Mameliella alba]MBY6177602.1 molybdopterin-dependent oxidoreductase [Mameliella alba]
MTNSVDRAEFDRALLQTLDWVEIVTHTPFTEGPQTFAGPTLASLLKALGVEDGTLLATALNDYTIDIPVADAWAHDVLLAVDHDGRPMRTRNRGPIWIVYPAATPDDFEDVHGARMIWQLNRIRVQR